MDFAVFSGRNVFIHVDIDLFQIARGVQRGHIALFGDDVLLSLIGFFALLTGELLQAGRAQLFAGHNGVFAARGTELNFIVLILSAHLALADGAVALRVGHIVQFAARALDVTHFDSSRSFFPFIQA